ncbi:UNKNOWN [Stylonychia lemnae]|uniref:Uncharacterized protein n=1 Tax=Stylonychia lemnae TaxID=5949 RepID=A0A077ZYV2_STYLE|nr:UNKNOWN [Stylonychia lemnae]|eukprot:CDW75136.1 UNKNOWN [Stylonychia lemnae]
MSEGSSVPNYHKVWYNTLHFKKKKGGNHDLGIEIEGVIPSAGEIRLLGNRHKQCLYYTIGVDVCQTQMMQQNADNFLACKEPIDGMWRCYTEGKYGQSIRESPDYTKVHERKFYDCLFKEAAGLDVCQTHFNDMIRSVYRSPENELCDWY